MPRSRAFTLMEVLVIISLIVLLLAMLQPAFRNARRRAQTVECISQLHQIGHAANAYSVDHREMYARDHWFTCTDPAAYDYRHYSFIGRYSDYVNGPAMPLEADADPTSADLIKAAGSVEVWRCPAEPDARFNLTYVTNGVNYPLFQSSGAYGSGPMSALTKLPGNPSQVMFMTEANTQTYHSPTGIGVYDIFTADAWIFQGAAANPAPRMIRVGDDKHLNNAPLLFFDNHAEARVMTPDELPLTLLNPLDVH